MGRASDEVVARVTHMSAAEQAEGRVEGDRAVFEEDRVGVHPAQGSAGVGSYDDDSARAA